MIKINCKAGIEPVKIEYPCLKKSAHYGRIVLFIARNTGWELDGGSLRSDFRYSETWVEEDFQLYTGTIELSNEL